MLDGTAETTWVSQTERPGKRWLDMIKMAVKRWRTKATDKGEWRKICDTAKVLQEL
jgi:hypothetical protein